MREVRSAHSVRELALAAIEAGVKLQQQVDSLGLGDSHDYAALLAEQKILPPLDHPDPAHMLISGTGLTHLGSASARDKMHQGGDDSALTDTMRIFKWGVEGGKPAAGRGRRAAGVVLQGRRQHCRCAQAKPSRCHRLPKMPAKNRRSAAST